MNEEIYPGVGLVLDGQGALNDLDAEFVRSMFHCHGAVLFRGFRTSREDFRLFSERVFPKLVAHPNAARESYEDRTITRASPGAEHFFAHAEMGYSPMRPDVAWFYCERPATVGGETVIYDGVQILGALRDTTRRLFVERRLLFESLIGPESWRIIAPDVSGLREKLDPYVGGDFAYDLDEAGRLETRFVTSALIATRSGGLAFCNSMLDSRTPSLEGGEPIERGVVREIIGLTEELALPISWKGGEVLMIDNMRFMHGRRAFTDSRRNVVVRFANLG